MDVVPTPEVKKWLEIDNIKKTRKNYNVILGLDSFWWSNRSN